MHGCGPKPEPSPGVARFARAIASIDAFLPQERTPRVQCARLLSRREVEICAEPPGTAGTTRPGNDSRAKALARMALAAYDLTVAMWGGASATARNDPARKAINVAEIAQMLANLDQQPQPTAEIPLGEYV